MATKSIKWKMINTVIGLCIMFLFPFLPTLDPITEMGMVVVGAFLGMVYLWSTVDSIWPSLLGIMVIGLSGYTGEGAQGMTAAFAQAFGTSTVLIVLLSMILFGAIEYFGCAQYISRWLLTRKMINGRPYVFMFLYLFTSYILSALIGPVAAIMILWAVAAEILTELEIEKGDSFYPIFIVGTFLGATIGHPLLPFKSAVLMITGTFTRLTGLTIEYMPYIIFCFTMSMLLLLLYLLLIKVLYRPDLTKLRTINVEYFKKKPLPPMNKIQKFYMILLLVYVIALLLPSVLPKTLPGMALLTILGTLGVTAIAVIVAAIVHFDGKTALPFKQVAAKEMAWGVYFMIAAALFGANAIASDEVGAKAFLVQALSPVLGGHSELVFAIILFTIALIITNFANNAAMAVVLMPVIVSFTEQMGVSPIPCAMGVSMMVFVAMLTPAASPHSSMLHGRKDLVSTGDILRIGIPISLGAVVLYAFIGYPLANVLFL